VTEDSVITTHPQPAILVEPEWVAEHLHDAHVRLIEADEDDRLYEQAHIPGAIKLDWYVDVQDPLQFDFIDQRSFEALLARWGISNDTLVVFYGDRNNVLAALALWLFNQYGHTNVRIISGGRARWIAEGRELTRRPPAIPSNRYVADDPGESPGSRRDDGCGTYGQTRGERTFAHMGQSQEYAAT
jgi:thiosulfate/3-mercaptopyruvate sulfurtransferase